MCLLPENMLERENTGDEEKTTYNQKESGRASGVILTTNDF